MHWSSPLRAMTFNLRAPELDDGQNGWPYRKNFAADVIRDSGADLVATQEPLIRQLNDLAAALPEFAWVGNSRFGDRLDKFNAIFYRKTALDCAQWGQFWLSGEPDRPGSNTWRLPKPRFVTWAELRNAAGERLFVFNTHFPYRSSEDKQRLQSARLLAERIAAAPTDAAVIAAGDYNCGDDSAPYRLLTEQLDDAWKTAERRNGPRGTAHGFHGRPSKRRIDWILYRGLIQPRSTTTVATQFEGRFPSDHFPVVADFFV